ncbi:MAG: dipicolinate synthase subunit B [Deltaproteobacteria bacterium]
MRLQNIKVGFALTGSFCTFAKIIPEIQKLVEEGAEVFPIMSEASYNIDTRFGKAEDFINKIEDITEKKIISTITEAEPIGPESSLDVIVIAPCTGNTLAKLANGITDTTVLMAVKAHLRNNKPVVIGVSTNDGLGANAKNLGLLLNTKNIFFIPFSQDNPLVKQNSIVAKMELVVDTILETLKGKQIQPLLLGK